MNAKRVLIVGGGVSGLAAANRLGDAGIAAVIIEGRSRLGGRIHTVDVAGTDTSWVDMGAAWIDDHKTNKVYQLLAAAGTDGEQEEQERFSQCPIYPVAIGLVVFDPTQLGRIV